MSESTPVPYSTVSVYAIGTIGCGDERSVCSVTLAFYNGDAVPRDFVIIERVYTDVANRRCNDQRVVAGVPRTTHGGVEICKIDEPVDAPDLEGVLTGANGNVGQDFSHILVPLYDRFLRDRKPDEPPQFAHQQQNPYRGARMPLSRTPTRLNGVFTRTPGKPLNLNRRTSRLRVYGQVAQA